MNTIIRTYILIALGALATAVGMFQIGLPAAHLSIQNHHIQHVFFIMAGGLYGIALAMGLITQQKDKPWPGRGIWLAPTLVASLLVMIAMWPSFYPVIEANPLLHAMQHGVYIVLAGVASFSAYHFFRSAGWIVAFIQVIMAWGAAFGFGVNPGPSPLIAQVVAAASSANASSVSGEAVYQTCAACHGPEGVGMPGAFPPLAGHVPKLLAAENGSDYMVHVVLFGLHGQITANGQTYNGAMPSQSQLSDAEVAAVLNHISSAWGNTSPAGEEPFSAEDVEEAREEKLTPQQVYEQRAELGLP